MAVDSHKCSVREPREYGESKLLLATRRVSSPLKCWRMEAVPNDEVPGNQVRQASS